MIGTPIPKSRAIGRGTGAILYRVIIYSMVAGIWGLALKHDFKSFAFVGAAIGLLLGLIPALVISNEATDERSRDMMFGSSLFFPIAIAIGIVGLIIWGSRTIFF